MLILLLEYDKTPVVLEQDIHTFSYQNTEKQVF